MAVDLSLRRQIVYSAWDTPFCQVADAVVASSAIPFAFAPSEFVTETSPVQSVRSITVKSIWSSLTTELWASR